MFAELFFFTVRILGPADLGFGAAFSVQPGCEVCQKRSGVIGTARDFQATVGRGARANPRFRTERLRIILLLLVGVIIVKVGTDASTPSMFFTLACHSVRFFANS